MNFLPVICVVSMFVGMMLLLTIKTDSAGGKTPCLPRSARGLAIHLIGWSLALLLVWVGTRLVWH